jgi:hypothetical protein
MTTGIQSDSGGVTANYEAHFLDILSKKCHINLGPILNIYSYVRNWKRITVNCAWPSLT